MVKLDDLDPESIEDLKAFINIGGVYVVFKMGHSWAIEEYVEGSCQNSEDALIVSKEAFAQWESEKRG